MKVAYGEELLVWALARERGSGRGLWISATIGKLEVSRGGANAVRGAGGKSTSWSDRATTGPWPPNCPAACGCALV